MTTIAHSPTKATFSLRSFAVVVILLSVIGLSLMWAFTSPATPQPVGPQASPVPTPPTAIHVVAAPAQPAVVNPQPVPMPVPTPPVTPSSTSVEPQSAAMAVTPTAPTALWVLPVALLLGVLFGLKLRRAASFQPRAFAR